MEWGFVDDVSVAIDVIYVLENERLTT
jgi:hypothetical protein